MLKYHSKSWVQSLAADVDNVIQTSALILSTDTISTEN